MKVGEEESDHASRKWRELLQSLFLEKLMLDVPSQPRKEANKQLCKKLVRYI
jgi:hypothetical protein